MFGRIGPMEIILILAVALVIFGPKKLPEIGKALGDAVRLFKRSLDKTGDAEEKQGKPLDPPASPDEGPKPPAEPKA